MSDSLVHKVTDRLGICCNAKAVQIAAYESRVKALRACTHQRVVFSLCLLSLHRLVIGLYKIRPRENIRAFM